MVTGFLDVVTSTHFASKHTCWYELLVYSGSVDEFLLFLGNHLDEFNHAFTPLHRPRNRGADAGFLATGRSRISLSTL